MSSRGPVRRQESCESDSASSKSPLSNFKEFPMFSGPQAEEKKLKGIFRTGIFGRLTGAYISTADGSQPKKRGPKPDAKPALTRRQELNRQAQRTHRERKEMYIKALEQEVLRLKDVYGDVAQQRDEFKRANHKLRELLIQHGIQIPPELNESIYSPPPASSSGSWSGSYPPASSSGDPSSPPSSGWNSNGPLTPQTTVSSPMESSSLNVDQVGINFVLALERPCMDHMQMLCVKSQDSEEEVSGHALMATCPPANHMLRNPEVQYPHQMPPNIAGGDLLKLLDLSARLPLTGEITPVMAWACIMRDARFAELSEEAVLGIMNELLPKVRCYGFGAVLEEFEVRDALESAIPVKMEMMSLNGH